MQRASLAALGARGYDVLVIGGGIYGAMVARDAALRGLRTALIDRGDFGSDVSHNSMKVMHGGIRYVQHLDFARLRASARECAFWQRAAGAHVRPLPFLMPLVGWGVKGPLAFGGAAALYNAASAGSRGPLYPPARVLRAAAARARLGDLAPAGLTGGGYWTDGQIVDANRLLLACVAACAEAGGDVANHVAADGLIARGGRVLGARVTDRINGGTAEIRAGITVSCTGAGAAGIARSACPDMPEARFPRFARAMNLLVERPPPAIGLGVVSRSRSDAVVDRGGRLYFLTPWRGRTMVGTHEASHMGGESWDAGMDEIDAFLDEINRACPTLDLSRGDVAYCYAGLIPADIDDAASGGRVRRRTRGTLIDHEAEHGLPGLVTLIGIKYTTARLMAERCVDLVAARLGKSGPASPSLHTPLSEVGDGEVDLSDEGALRERVRRAVRDELAMTLADVVIRRMPLAETGALSGSGGDALLRRVAAMVRAELGLDGPREARDVAEAERALLRSGIVVGTSPSPQA